VFEAKALDKTSRVSVDRSMQASVFPAEKLTLAYGGREVVFDARGIGIKKGNQVAWSRVPAIAITPKINTPDEINETNKLIREGKREAGFSGLSGYEYVGSTLYVLLRWENKDGTPWLEAVAGIDMSQPDLVAKLVGRMPGISFARGTVDDQLKLNGNSLVALAQGPDGWGLASWNLTDSTSDFKVYGERATMARFMNGLTNAISLEATSYGSTIATWVDVNGGDARPIAEVRGAIKSLEEPYFLHYIKFNRHYVRNLMSGNEIEIEPDSAFSSTDIGLIVWAPAEAPKRAWFIESDTGRVFAQWKSVVVDSSVTTHTPPPGN
jgi:hypothetical protein